VAACSAAKSFQETAMTVNRIVRIVAGFFVLMSLALGVQGSPLFVSENWLWFTAFVGANLFQSGFTTFCPLDMILKRLGVREGAVSQ
jgi:hypothetical protein